MLNFSICSGFCWFFYSLSSANNSFYQCISVQIKWSWRSCYCIEIETIHPNTTFFSVAVALHNDPEMFPFLRWVTFSASELNNATKSNKRLNATWDTEMFLCLSFDVQMSTSLKLVSVYHSQTYSKNKCRNFLSAQTMYTQSLHMWWSREKKLLLAQYRIWPKETKSKF